MALYCPFSSNSVMALRRLQFGCRTTSLSTAQRIPRALHSLPVQSRHDFHTSQRHSNNSLFNLGGLSTSRECQYLAKERGMPRTEFSPHLELIRSSEVDTFGGPGSRKSSTSSIQAPLDPILRLDDAALRIQRLEDTCQGLLEGLKKRAQEDRSRRDLLKVLAGATAGLTLFWTMAVSSELSFWRHHSRFAESVNVETKETTMQAMQATQQLEQKEVIGASISPAPLRTDPEDDIAVAKPRSIFRGSFWASSD